MKVMTIAGNGPCIHLFVLISGYGRSAFCVVVGMHQRRLCLVSLGNVGQLVSTGVNAGLRLFLVHVWVGL